MQQRTVWLGQKVVESQLVTSNCNQKMVHGEWCVAKRTQHCLGQPFYNQHTLPHHVCTDEVDLQR